LSSLNTVQQQAAACFFWRAAGAFSAVLLLGSAVGNGGLAPVPMMIIISGATPLTEMFCGCVLGLCVCKSCSTHSHACTGTAALFAVSYCACQP
jgi:hypothetical protein